MRCVILMLFPFSLSFSPAIPDAASVAELPALELDATGTLPTAEQFAEFARADPVRMLEFSVARYQREVQGYRVTLDRLERVNGKLRVREVVKVGFRESPFSVAMQWEKGGDRAAASLFVAGENKDKVLIRPRNSVANFLVGYVSRDPDNEEVKAQSRYSIREFGIQMGTIRTYLAWKAAQECGAFRYEYLGVREVPEAGGRRCHVIRRDVNPAEEDGLTDVTICIDTETWMQVSSRLMAGSELIAEYHFRDIEMNPTFAADTFTPASLKK